MQPAALENLIGALRVLPEVGPKSAARMADHLLPRDRRGPARRAPLDGIGPREIHLDRLIDRALDGVVEEVILATNFTPEGEATAHTIGELLKARGLKVSRLARGVPVGGELEYVDSGTLAQAVRDRRI